MLCVGVMKHWNWYLFCHDTNNFISGTSVHKNKISIEGFINENELTLICHVKDLFLQVDILHESECEAKCYPPYPRSTCFSFNKGDITQNLKTNCTKLVVRLDEKKYKSFWSCQHGSNGEKSDQILVQKEGKLFRSFPSTVIG